MVIWKFQEFNLGLQVDGGYTLICPLLDEFGHQIGGGCYQCNLLWL
jgi:hypothetical protein